MQRRGAGTSAGEFEEALDLIRLGTVNVRGILTKTVSMDEAPGTIVEIEKHPEKYLKVNVMME